MLKRKRVNTHHESDLQCKSSLISRGAHQFAPVSPLRTLTGSSLYVDVNKHTYIHAHT